MRKLLYFLTVILMSPMGSVFPETLSNYVSEVKGDTLVVKDYYQMALESNSLYWVLTLDTLDVPPNRVYELKVNGYYPLDRTPLTSANRRTVIAGSDPTRVVNNKNADSSPPLICGNVGESASGFTCALYANGDLTIKNCTLVPAANDGTIGWTFVYAQAPGLHLVFDNCVMEHTRWVFVALEHPNCAVTFSSCYFVNMSGGYGDHGGVFDCLANQDSLLVENCTHVMAQGTLYHFGTNSFNRMIFNHNTFINCAGLMFNNSSYYNNVSIVSNLFVNCNLHPFDACNDDMPVDQMGLINLYTDDADTVKADQKRYLAYRNLAYWDPFLEDCEIVLDTNGVNGSTCWTSQRILMDESTQLMFDNDRAYPYLDEGNWYEQMPTFMDPKDLLTTRLSSIKDFVIDAADDSNEVSLPGWRLINTGSESFVHPDWPVPVDLSYDNPDLIAGAYGGFPIGDLNWFPAEKAAWLFQRDIEYAYIEENFNFNPFPPDGVGVENHLPQEFSLDQNYPNPFNPSTTISFSIPKACRVSLKVYDIRGREVAALLDDFVAAKTYDLRFDGTDFPSGVYTCTLQYDDVSVSRKMLVMK